MIPIRLILGGLFCAMTSLQAGPSAEEVAVITFFKHAGARLSFNEQGQVTKLFYGGKPVLTVAELQQVGALSALEEFAINAAPGGDADWTFLKQLPKLRSLTIWHGKYFSSLVPFCDLPIESLTIGGCMGLRDLNKATPEKQRDAILALRGLPNLKRANLYHSPTLSTDAHIAHLVKQCPKLVDLKVDFSAPRGFETRISPEGLAQLQQLPLTVISIEHANSLTPEHMQALAKVRTLEAVLVDGRRNSFDTTPLVTSLRALRPDLEIVVVGADAAGPPVRARKPNEK